MAIGVANLVGLSAPQALQSVLSELRGVREVRLAEIRPLPLLQNRFDLTEAEETVFERACDLRSRIGISFWDAALLELPSMPAAIRLLDASMMHVSLRGLDRPLPWASAIVGGLERECAKFSTINGASLALLSEIVYHDGSIRHLPMVDFHALESGLNERIVEQVARRLFPGGSLILKSGESYHAYGMEIVSESELMQFLGRAMLCAPIVDRAYVAHQVIEGRCALRITSGGGKSRVPVVVAVLPGR